MRYWTGSAGGNAQWLTIVNAVMQPALISTCFCSVIIHTQDTCKGFSGDWFQF